MPISIPAAPARSIAALREALPSVANRAALTRVAPRLAASLTAANAASVTPALSYQVYTLGLSDLIAAASDDLKEAKPSLWRHVLISDGDVITADTSIDHTGTHYRFAALTLNPAAGAVRTTIDALQQDARIAKASYEVSLLQISALGVRAVWLHDPTRKSPDLLIPVPPVRSELVAGRRYTVAEIVEALRHAAERILGDDDPQKGAT